MSNVYNLNRACKAALMSLLLATPAEVVAKKDGQVVDHGFRREAICRFDVNAEEIAAELNKMAKEYEFDDIIFVNNGNKLFEFSRNDEKAKSQIAQITSDIIEFEGLPAIVTNSMAVGAMGLN